MNHHEQAIEKVRLHPQLLGLEGVLVMSAKEVMFFREGHLVGEMDNYVQTEKGIWIHEYKTFDNINARKKARHQLDNARRFVYDLEGEQAITLYGHGNGNYRRIA
jgi:hypothetical protein